MSLAVEYRTDEMGLNPRQRDKLFPKLRVLGVERVGDVVDGDAGAACLFSRVVMMLDLFLHVHGLTFSTLPPCRAV